jgi:tRNA modification GTPase
VQALAQDIGGALAGAKAGERLREGVTVVVAGRPNAGKSSLLNRLAGRDVAIVTDVPGTTRDLIEVQLDLGGLPLTLVDTAGLRETEDIVEREGVTRARRRVASADLVLWVTDARAPDAPCEGELPDEIPVWVLANKIDLIEPDPVIASRAQAFGGPGWMKPTTRTPSLPGLTRQSRLLPFGPEGWMAGPSPAMRERIKPRVETAEEPQFLPSSVSDEAIQLSGVGREAGLLRCASNDEAEPVLAISCTTGAGLTDLLSALEDRLADMLSGGETALVAEARQRRALEDAAAALSDAGNEEQAELLAESLRRATDALGRITGRIDVEQVLDAVFSRFCIGK